jgi:hypothetical protein
MTEKKKSRFADLSALRFDQGGDSGGEFEVFRSSVPVRKPKHDFFRVHPDEDYRISPLGIYVAKESRDDVTYLVTHEMEEAFPAQISRAVIFTAINTQGALFLWPVKFSRDGHPNGWLDSAMEAARAAMEAWVRIEADLGAEQYTIRRAIGARKDPKWETVPPLSDLLERAFPPSRVIDSVEHPVVQKLLGA